MAFGGRFDNLVAHYQLEIAKYSPQAVCCNLRVKEIARQILNTHSRLLQPATLIDVCIGSKGCRCSQVELKVKLLADLQRRDLRVHVDYSEDMTQQLTDEFLSNNNVKVVVQLQNDEDIIKVWDRQNNLN